MYVIYICIKDDFAVKSTILPIFTNLFAFLTIRLKTRGIFSYCHLCYQYDKFSLPSNCFDVLTICINYLLS